RMRLPGRVAPRRLAVLPPLLRLPTREHRRPLGLAGDDPGTRPFLAQYPGDALQRPARAETRHEIVELVEIAQNFLGRGLRVKIRVGLVDELPGEEPAVRGRQ